MADPFFANLMAQYQDPYEEMNQTARSRLELIPGLREDLLSQRKATYENSPEEYGNMIGSFLLPALAGTITNDWQTGLGWGAASSGARMQALGAQEAEDRKLFDQKIGLLDEERQNLMSFTQGNDRAMASAGNQLALNYFTGNVVGSGPYEQERADSLAAQKELYGMRAAGSGGGQDKPDGIFDPNAVEKHIGIEGLITPGAPNMSASQVQAATGLGTYANSRQSLQSRVNQAASKAVSSGIPGYVALPGFNAPPDKLDKLREMDSFRRASIGSLDELEKMMVEREALGQPPIDFQQKAPLFTMLAKQAVPWARAYGGTGASLTGTGRAGEISQLASMTPPGADELTQDGYDYLVRTLKGQNPIEFVRDLRRTMQQRTLDRAMSYNIYDPEMQEYYNERDRALIDNLGPEFGMQNPWGKYVDILKQSRAGNPILQQQAELSGAPTTTAPQITGPTGEMPQPPGAGTPPPIRNRMQVFTNPKTGQRKTFWVDQNGNRLDEVG